MQFLTNQSSALRKCVGCFTNVSKKNAFITTGRMSSSFVNRTYVSPFSKAKQGPDHSSSAKSRMHKGCGVLQNVMLPSPSEIEDPDDH
jgi:hypothetical protein